jgi:uncharacterized membrane-anchored protein YitT (DUF2179 family)
MGDPQYFNQKTYWSIKWYNLMIVNIVILLFYSLILPVPYTAYIFMFFVVSWLFYVIKYLELREEKKKEKKDELESIDK